MNAAVDTPLTSSSVTRKTGASETSDRSGDVTTLGTVIVSEILPPSLRRKQYVFDKKSTLKLFQQLAAENPEQYKDVLNKLSAFGKTAAWTEGVTVNLAALTGSKVKEQILAPVRRQVQDFINDDSLTEEQRREKIVNVLIAATEPLTNAVAQEASEKDLPYSVQVDSGARGSKVNLNSLRGADLVVTGADGSVLPVPVFHSYAEGLSPAEYFATTFGQRKGTLMTKMSTAKAGFISKQLANATHRQLITKERPDPTRLPVGLAVKSDDQDNIGCVLALPAGDYPEGTLLTSSILAELKDAGVEDLLVHSPATEYNEDGGLSAYAAGRRTKRGLHDIGDNVGLNAAQAIGENLSQGSLSAKHSAGVSDRLSKAGLAFVQKFISSPENFTEAAPVAEEDGTVTGVVAAPQGGSYVHMGSKKYYIGPDLAVTVKPGETLEAGDTLADGLAHPTKLIKARGLGEARRVYMDQFRKVLKSNGLSPHRRNLESVVAGLLNWVRVNDLNGIGDYGYDDIVPAGALLHGYKPRSTSRELELSSAKGQYLDESALHYTPGTRLTSRVVKDLAKWKIPKVFVNKEPPNFEPELVRSVLSVYHDPDWRTRLSGFYTASAFEKSVQSGASSDTQGTSYVPGLARAKTFGKMLSQGKYGSVLELSGAASKVVEEDGFDPEEYDDDDY